MADRPLVVLVSGFVALLATVLAALWMDSAQQSTFGWVRHTLEVEARLSTVQNELQEAESGERGYLLAGRPEFLVPYDRALYRLQTELDALGVEIADNAGQAAALRELRTAIQRRLALLQLGVALEQQDRAADARDPVRLMQGRAAMDEARRIIAGMRGEEERLLQERRITAHNEGLAVTVFLVLSIFATAILGFVAYRDGSRRLTSAVETSKALSAALSRAEAEVASREVAEGEMRQMQRLESVGQLTGGIAHDFNNMLAIILGSLELAMRRLTGGEDPRVAVSLDHAVHGARRAAQLTARLLAFSRQQPLAPRALDANRMVAGMSELLRRTIGEQLDVETVLAGGLWTTYADPGQLENAVLNLAVNARDAMPDGGKLTIETANGFLDADYAEDNPGAEAGQYVLISVTDTGSGMPPDVVQRAFDPFYTTKGPGRGTGLGLSQVFGFVRQSGGHVKIYSEPGLGTTVKLYLPRWHGPEAPAEPADAAHTPPRARVDEVILVVEDEERVRQLSVESLRELGYAVAEAPSATEALDVLSSGTRVDLLFTDVVMPQMNGRRLAEEAVALRRGLKVLYTTGHTRNAIVHNGVLDAGVAFLPKPYTLDQLAAAVRRVLDARA
jgi:signal transduction histidine kinase